MAVRRFLLGGVAALSLVLSGCGGSDSDPEPGSGGVAAPTSTSAPAPAEATATDSTASEPAGSGSAAGCLGIASTVTSTVTKVAEAGFDYGKAAGEFTAGAQAVRSKLPGLPAAAAKAAGDLATAMDSAASAAKNIDTSNPQPYVDAQQKVGSALVALGNSCGG